MTEYEKLVEDKVIPPMNAMDALMINLSVDEAIKMQFVSEEEKVMLKELWLEIEYLLIDEPEKLDKIERILDIKKV